MQQPQDDDGKDGRYFPSDSEMQILIHYLQVYFSHPERSIQRSQVVQNVVSILSPTNKHWNHRTIRLWFNNNKRVFFRPNSPQQLQEPNQISPSASAPASFSQDPEPPSQPSFMSTPIPKYYMPARSLSVGIQKPANVIDTTQDQQVQQYLNQNMNASQWERFMQQQQQQQQRNKPKKGTFASHLIDINNTLNSNPFSIEMEKGSELQITEKIVSLNNQKWNIITPEQSCKDTILDKNTIPIYPNTQDPFSLQTILPLNSNFLGNVYPSSSTPPSPPPAPSPGLIQNPMVISNPNSPTSSPAPSSPSYSISPTNPTIPSSSFPIEVSSYDLIECSTFTQSGVPIIISYDTSVQADQIHLNFNTASNAEDAVLETGFLSSASSIAFDEEASHLWVHSGNFVRSFHCTMSFNPSEFTGDVIQSDQTILTGPHRSQRSAMTFWDKSLVLSSNSTILTWKPEFMYPPPDSSVKEELDEDEEEEKNQISEYFGVCLTLIVPCIDALTTVDDYLVVASSEYHTAHIIAPNGACASRAIGHTAGITALNKYDINSFITGSADQTAKFWDLRVPLAVHNILGHKGIVTSVFGEASKSSNSVFTGGTDGLVKAWDLRMMKKIFDIDVGEATPQSIFFDTREKVLKVVVSEKCKEYFYDLGKFFDINNTEQFVDYGLNSVLSFHCPDE